MNRSARWILRVVLVVSAWSAPGLASGAADPAGPKPKQPNILVLFSDDQRADTIGALGNDRIRTPNLDRLVREGTTFERAYCMGSWHGAVCQPSRAMLLTGRTLFRVKPDLKGQTGWPEAFAGRGYATFLTGKWHNGAESALRLFQQGKAVFFGGMGPPYNLPIQDFSPDRQLVNKRISGGHSVQVFADAAIEFLQSRRGVDAPFLCYTAFNLPHDPRTAPAVYHERYRPEALAPPANFLPEHPFNNGDLATRDERLAPWPRTPEIVRRHLADYYAAIEFVDAQVGRILDALRASGHGEDTLIVYSSDHGLAIGSHGLFGKQSLYDHSMHAPLILAGPGVPKGRRTDALCYLLDVFPTLGELAGAPAPEGSEGVSLVPVLDGRKPAVRDSIFTAYARVQRAVRDDRWKLIVYPNINKVQLFDLKTDPAETADRAGDPRRADEVNRLLNLLRDWQRRLGDDLPLRSDHPEPAEFDFSRVEAEPAPAARKRTKKKP